MLENENVLSDDKRKQVDPVKLKLERNKTNDFHIVLWVVNTRLQYLRYIII